MRSRTNKVARAGLMVALMVENLMQPPFPLWAENPPLQENPLQVNEQGKTVVKQDNIPLQYSDAETGRELNYGRMFRHPKHGLVATEYYLRKEIFSVPRRGQGKAVHSVECNNACTRPGKHDHNECTLGGCALKCTRSHFAKYKVEQAVLEELDVRSQSSLVEKFLKTSQRGWKVSGEYRNYGEVSAGAKGVKAKAGSETKIAGEYSSQAMEKLEREARSSFEAAMKYLNSSKVAVETEFPRNWHPNQSPCTTYKADYGLELRDVYVKIEFWENLYRVVNPTIGVYVMRDFDGDRNYSGIPGKLQWVEAALRNSMVEKAGSVYILSDAPLDPVEHKSNCKCQRPFTPTPGHGDHDHKSIEPEKRPDVPSFDPRTHEMRDGKVVPRPPSQSVEKLQGKNQVFFAGQVQADEQVLTSVRGPARSELDQITFEGTVAGRTVRAKADGNGRAILDVAALAAGITASTVAVIRAVDAEGREIARTTTQIAPAGERTAKPELPSNIRRGGTYAVRGDLGPETSASLNGAPQEVLAASRNEAVYYAGSQIPAGPQTLRVENSAGQVMEQPVHVIDTKFVAPKSSIQRGETLAVAFEYHGLPEGTTVEFTNQTPAVISLKAPERSSVAGDGLIQMTATGKMAGNFEIGGALNLPVTQTFTFPNEVRDKEGAGVDTNDLHIQFSEPVTVKDSGPFKKPKGAQNSVNLAGGTVKAGESAEVQVDSKGDAWIQAWHWTLNGNFVGCSHLTYRNAKDSKGFGIEFKEPVEIRSATAGGAPVSPSPTGKNNGWSVAGDKAFGEVTLEVCPSTEKKGDKNGPEVRGVTWK